MSEPRLPVKDIGVVNGHRGVEWPETIRGLPIVPGYAVGILLPPLDLSRLAGRRRLENQSASRDALELADVALLGVTGGQMDQVPPREHEVELPVGESREGGRFEDVAVREVRRLSPAPLLGLGERLAVDVDPEDVAVPALADLPEILGDVAAGLENVAVGVQAREKRPRGHLVDERDEIPPATPVRALVVIGPHAHEHAAAPRELPVAWHAALQAFAPVFDPRPRSREAGNVFTGEAQIAAEGGDQRPHDSRSGPAKGSHLAYSSAARARARAGAAGDATSPGPGR